MATNTNKQSIFSNVSQRGRARLATANVTRDLSTTVNASVLVTAPTEGCRISSVTWTHSAAVQTQTSVAAVGRLFITDAAGANPRLIKEIVLPAVAPSATAIGAVAVMTLTPDEGFLKSGEFFWVSISATQTSGNYDIVANGGDFTP